VGLITALLVKSPGKKQTVRALRKPRRATSPLVWAAIFPLPFILFTGRSNIPSAISLPVPLWVKLLLYVFFAAFVSGMTILVVAIRRNFPRFERTLRYVGIGAASVLFILVVLRTGSLPPWAGPGGWLVVSCLSIIPALFVRVPDGHPQAERATKPLRNSMSPRVWIIVTPVLFLVFCMEFEFIGIPDYPDFSAALIVWFLTGLAGLIILLTIKIGSRERTDLPRQEALQQVQVQG
jgi:hypothetical protein